MTETTGVYGVPPARRSSAPIDLVGRLQGLPAALRLLRPHQWIKNLFVAAPIFFTPSARTPENILLVLCGVASFCLIASAVYVLNDYMDRDADRMHPKKRTRPIASGAVSVPAAAFLFTAVLSAGLGIAFLLDPRFGLMASVYFAINVAYSMGLKDVSILDVLTITLGFVLRVFAGAAIIAVVPSVWIIMCTGLVALFLALAKRRDDLTQSLGIGHRRALEGYTKPFLDTAISVVLGALLVTYIMYTTDERVAAELQTDQLYFTVLFVVAGIMRYLQIALVEERSGAPTMIVLTDRFLIGCMALWVLAFSVLIHV